MKVYVVFTRGCCGRYGEPSMSGVFATKEAAESTVAHLKKRTYHHEPWVSEQLVEFTTSHTSCYPDECRTAKRRAEKKEKAS